MRVLPFAACLLAALLAAPATLASTPGPQLGPFAGTVAQGETDAHPFSTHGDQPCLAVWLPRLYVVALAYAPVDDTLTLTAAGNTDTGSSGHASVSFVANYCTAFTITVSGTAVSDSAAYTVVVQSVPLSDLLCCLS